MSIDLDEAPSANGTEAPVKKPARATRSATGAKSSAVRADGDPMVIKPIDREVLRIPVIGTAPLIVSRFSEKAKRQMLDAQTGVKKEKERRNPVQEFENSLYRAGFATAAEVGDLSWSEPDLLMPDPDALTGRSITEVRPAGEETGDAETGGVAGIELDVDFIPAFYAPKPGDPLFALPSMAFKMATIAAARLYGKAVKMTELRQFMYFDGIQVPTEPNRVTIIQGTPLMREDYVRLAGINRPADLRYRGCFYQWKAVIEVAYTRNLLDRNSLINLVEAGGQTVGVGEWRPERDGEFGTFRIDDARPIRVLRRSATVPARKIVEGDA